MGAEHDCLAVDAMGGDLGPRLTVPATLSFLRAFPRIQVRFFGVQDAVAPLLDDCPPSLAERVSVHHCPEQVGMEEKPGSALRRKRNSSLWHALGAVADGDADACVSAGNTGALMAMAMARLGVLPGIDRPAICTAVPTRRGHAYLLDMGANVECTATQLQQFARMAARLANLVDGIQQPSVGLLNIGREPEKGEPTVREAARLLAEEKGMDYRGYVEGDGIFSGDVDVIVCDGLVGNIALKTSEGVARMIVETAARELTGSWRGKLAAAIGAPVLRGMAEHFDPSLYNGASLLGLNGVVVKSHGRTDSKGFQRALHVAHTEARQSLPARIGRSLKV